jgi:hypothetical protein
MASWLNQRHSVAAADLRDETLADDVLSKFGDREPRKRKTKAMR